MTDHRADLHPSTWDPALDAVIAAPKHHKVLFENECLRVLDVTLEPNEEEPVHHHRWPSVFVFDQVQGPVHDFAPDGTQLPPNRDVIKAIEAWDGQGLFGREHGAATSRTGPQRLGKDAPRHPSRDEDSAESVVKRTLSASRNAERGFRSGRKSFWSEVLQVCSRGENLA